MISMKKLGTLKEKITRFHIMSTILMLIFILSSLRSWFFEIWDFTIGFVHESGHAYFDLLFGSPYIIITNNPPQTGIMESNNIIENIFIILGGVIFATVFLSTCILFIFLIFKYKGWQYRRSVNLGTDTIGFQINLFLFSYIFTEILIDFVPHIITNNRLNDGGILVINYLHIHWFLITDPISIAILNFSAIFIVLSYMLLITNCFYCIIKKISVKHIKNVGLDMKNPEFHNTDNTNY